MLINIKERQIQNTTDSDGIAITALMDGDYTTPIPSGLGNNLYDKNPTEKSSAYPTINHLNYDGLLAVMNFIKKNPDIKKNPAYFITTVGLTPWQGSGRTGADVYWDSAFVPAIFFYIPSIETLSGRPRYF